MNCILDTSAYSLAVAGHATAGTVLQKAEQIYLPPQVIAELRYGFALGSKRLENERALTRFLDSSRVERSTVDTVTIDWYVILAVFSRSKGRVLSQNDYWIAASAMQHNVTLVTADKDFEILRAKGLKLELLK